MVHNKMNGANKLTVRQQGWQGMNWISQTSRLALYLRDGLSCAWCGDSVENGAQLSLDHLKPHIKGGTNQVTNLVTACKRCNSSRGDRPVTRFAEACAAYLDHSLTGKQIASHVRKQAAKDLTPYRAQARQMIAERGSAAKVLAARVNPEA